MVVISELINVKEENYKFKENIVVKFESESSICRMYTKIDCYKHGLIVVSLILNVKEENNHSQQRNVESE